MIYTKEVENMCPVAKGAKHEPALKCPIAFTWESLYLFSINTLLFAE